MRESIESLKATSTLALLTVLTGCAGTGALVQAPEVRLDRVEVTAATLDRQTFTLGFTMDNPNAFPLPVRAVRYRMRLNEQSFVGGEVTTAMTVPAGGEGEFELTIDFNLVESGGRLASLLKSAGRENVSYELYGKLDLDLPMSPSLAFDHKGTISTQTAAR